MSPATRNGDVPIASILRTGLGSEPVTPQRSSACEACSLKSGCLPSDLRPADLEGFSQLARLKRKVRHGVTLFAAGDVLTAIYVVRSGMFKTVTVSREGHPKITGFYLPGDVMGLDAINESVYPFDAIALEHSEVCVLPIRQLETMASTVPALQKQFIRALSAEISRDHGLMLLLGSMDAEQRVTRLLLSLAERYHRLGYASDALFLHMTRDEIASYLGLSSETVSRVMSRLQRKGLLTVHQRHIDFTDCAQLTETSAW
jgi:CRP/FNR family transcriptional regulator, anaerobic regulatory protein